MKLRFYRPLFLAVAILGMLFALGFQLQPGRPHAYQVPFFHWDYWVDTLKHLAGFTLLGCAYFAGVYPGGELSFRRFVRTVWPVVLFGAVVELLQLWVPHRSCNVFDLLANTGGPLLGYVAIRWLLPDGGLE